MFRFTLATKVFIGFVVGVVAGLIFKEQVLVIKPLGDIFLNLIKMLVAPLIFFSIISSISSLENVSKLKQMGGKVLMYYLVTTVMSALLGLALANMLQPGGGFLLTDIVPGKSVAAPVASLSFADAVVGMVPVNPFKALAETNLIQIIVFCLFMGVSITALGSVAKPFKAVCDSGAKIMYKVTEIVMGFSPIGVAALMACAVGEYGLKVFGPLGKLVGSLYLGGFVIILLMYFPMIKFIGKTSISYFVKKILKVCMMTISTTSSAGTLPLTLKTAKEDFKVSGELADFALPLGATVNMNGAVLFYAITVVFVSQIYQVDLSFYQQLYLVLLASIIAIGSPGIPGGGIVMTMILLSAMGLPLEIMGMIAGIYRLFDMCNTTINVMGDVVSTVCIAQTEDMIEA